MTLKLSWAAIPTQKITEVRDVEDLTFHLAMVPSSFQSNQSLGSQPKHFEQGTYSANQRKQTNAQEMKVTARVAKINMN